VPFKVPFNTVSVDPQTTSRSVGPTCDNTKPLRDPNSALEVATVELMDDDEQSPPCGSASFPSRLKCGRCQLKISLFFLASPLSLSDHEIDLDVSFSQKIPVGFLPHETAPDWLTVFSSPRQMTGTPHTKRSNERYARFSCTALGVMIDGVNSSQSCQTRIQGM
jgi:hypothetical protein